MRNFLYLIVLFSLAIQAQNQQASKADELREIVSPYFVPVAYDKVFLKEEENKIALGKALFYEKEISEHRTISCNSCHNLNKGGTNGEFHLKQKEKGIFYRDVPTVYNVASLPLFNADGGAHSFKNKIESSFYSVHEMGIIAKDTFENRLKHNKKYIALFQNAYPEEDVSFANAIDALHMYIKGLITPAPIDRFIAGDNNALTKSQIEGGLVFNALNCFSCHTGSNFGGQMIQKLGIVHPWPNQKDLGHYHLNKNPDYKMFFRVAPLRNVALTAPYFHDGSSTKIWKAIQRMGKYERGIQVSVADALKIKEFLKSLTGKIDNSYIKEPNKL